MSACPPLIICKQNILKRILSAFIARKLKITKFRCFFGVVWHGDFFINKKYFFRKINKTGRHLILLGGEQCKIFRDKGTNQIAQKPLSTCEVYAKGVLSTLGLETLGVPGTCQRCRSRL